MVVNNSEELNFEELCTALNQRLIQRLLETQQEYQVDNHLLLRILEREIIILNPKSNGEIYNFKGKLLTTKGLFENGFFYFVAQEICFQIHRPIKLDFIFSIA